MQHGSTLNYVKENAQGCQLPLDLKVLQNQSNQHR